MRAKNKKRRKKGDDCPSAKECKDEKKPHNISFVGSIYLYQKERAKENKGPGGLAPVTKDSGSNTGSGAIK